MALQEVAFGLMALVSVVAALCVVSAKNPVHSVLFLITVFFSAAGMFVLMGAEFLALLLVVVYVGAVAVLFLFVVMMLDVDFVALRQGFARYMPLGLAIGLVLLIEMVLVSVSVAQHGVAKNAAPATPDQALPNVQAIGQVLYTDYVYVFEAAGMVLLVAMIGAIVLTLRHRPGVKKQDIARQVARTPKTGMEVVSVEIGKGIPE
ncbi:MAG: NADH-quinone oxidoreductase subunit J [Caulobacteraceae bacterium]